jgi:putative acetyltransferase
MIIERETEIDYFEVENLTREAFWNIYQPGCSEHLVLHNLRKDVCFVPELDYVVKVQNSVVANIVYAKGILELDSGGKMELLLFGPVSVQPECQGKGYGKKIIKFTLNKAKELGYPAVVITGNPEYYVRFGFESASKYGIYYAGMDRKEEAPFFMIKVLNQEEIKFLQGTYYEPECYLVDQEELEVFDKRFSPKGKEVRPGQLR